MDIIEAIIFYILVFLAMFSAIGAIFFHKIIHSILCAFITFLCVGLLFFALELPYLATVQIALFAIGMSVLFVFALLLTGKDNLHQESVSYSPKMLFSFLGIVLIVLFLAVAIKFGSFFQDGLSIVQNCIMPSSKEISIDMFVNYGAPFVFVSFLFLAVVLGLGVITSNKNGGKN